jgi:hypothetical protein
VTTISREELADLIEHHAALLAAALRSSGDTTRPVDEQRTVGPAIRPREVPSMASWTKVGELTGETYNWPEGTETYAPFEVWETTRGGRKVQIGLGQATNRGEYYGRERGYWLVFEMVNGHKRRPIVVFTEGDHAKDLVAVIKGKGSGGRSMFSPGDALPQGYESLTVDVFRDRITGPQAYNRLAVVAENGDRETMLEHGLLQLGLRS